MQLLGTCSEVLVPLLQSHGIKAVHDDGVVSLADSKLRFVLQVYKDGDKTILLEAMCRLCDGQLITERLAGVGDSQAEQVLDAQYNFLNSVFHVWLSALLGISNQYANEYSWTINGAMRKVVVGFPAERGGGVDEIEWQRDWHQAIQSMQFSNKLHWASLCYVRSPMVVACDALLNNAESTFLKETMMNLDWPIRNEFYSVRQFLIIAENND